MSVNNSSYREWAKRSRLVSLSPNYKRDFVLAAHRAMKHNLRRYPDLYRDWDLADWFRLEREFWRRSDDQPFRMLIFMISIDVVRNKSTAKD